MYFKNFYIVGIIGLVITLMGCSDPNGSNLPKKLTIGYMSNLMADIEDASALGISKKAVSTSRNTRTTSSPKNYLVKTTVEFSSGNVEWDENGLTNVTFKKRTTETIYINGKPVEDSQIVTQDEIPAQVNKLYVYNTYTFIQFVPDDTTDIPDTRPNDLGKTDRDGYFDYDKINYYNDEYHQSFVIENSTGNIYSLDNTVYIISIHNGLLKIKGSHFVWDCRIKNNDELEIFTLFQNATVEVYDYYKDKYGNNYIYNTGIDTIDNTTKTIYFIEPDYHVALSGEIVYIRGNGVPYMHGQTRDDYMSYFIGSKGFYFNVYSGLPNQIRIVENNLTFREITDTDELYFNGYDGLNGSDINNMRYLSHIKNKKLYFYQNRVWGRPNNNINIINTDNAVIEYSLCFDMDVFNVWAISYNTIVFITNEVDLGSPGNVYYYKVNIDTLPSGFNYENNLWLIENFINSSTSLVENVSFSPPGTNWVNFTIKWEIITINGRDEYTFILKDINNEKIPTIVKISEYVSEEQQVIILKPINR